MAQIEPLNKQRTLESRTTARRRQKREIQSGKLRTQKKSPDESLSLIPVINATKVKAELNQRLDKVAVVREEITDLERQQEMAKDNFDRISRQIKKEVEMFDVRKANDFKKSIVKYLEYMLKAQEKMTAQWERYLPEVQQISI